MESQMEKLLATIYSGSRKCEQILDKQTFVMWDLIFRIYHNKTRHAREILVRIIKHYVAAINETHVKSENFSLREIHFN